MHNQISSKRHDEPCLELGDGRWKIYPVSVAGVNPQSLKYENWTQFAVFERQTDEFGNQHWTPCEVPEWATLLLAERLG